MNLVDTSRPRREDEVDDREYRFITRSQFQTYIDNGQFVEYGEHEKHLFGTSINAIRDVVNNGKVCILNFHPQVCSCGIFCQAVNCSFV